MLIEVEYQMLNWIEWNGDTLELEAHHRKSQRAIVTMVTKANEQTCMKSSSTLIELYMINPTTMSMNAN